MAAVLSYWMAPETTLSIQLIQSFWSRLYSTLHTAITHMILMLKQQSLMHDYAIKIHEIPAFHTLVT